MIDLDKLRAVAAMGCDAVAEAPWLKQVLHELEQGRDAIEQLRRTGQTFGSRGPRQ